MSKIIYRVLDFFEAFAAEKRPLVLTELAKVLDIPASSCHTALRAMTERGYLYELKSRGGFYPTARLLSVAQTIVDSDPVLSRVEPTLQKLMKETGQSVFLAKADGATLTYLAVFHGEAQMQLTIQPGDHVRSLYASSGGKAVLGSLSQEALREVVDGLSMKPLTPNTITSRTALLRELDLSRKRGWYVNQEETIEDTVTISASFMLNSSLYVITIAGLLKPMTRKQELATQALMQAVRELGD